MELLLRIVVGALLVAHGLVHLLWFVKNDDARWPFRLDQSWLLPATVRRPVAVALVAVTVLAFLLLGLAVWGVPGMSASWPALAIGAAVVSLLALVAFWNWQLLTGVLIDVVLLVLAVWRPEWTVRRS